MSPIGLHSVSGTVIVNSSIGGSSSTRISPFVRIGAWFCKSSSSSSDETAFVSIVSASLTNIASVHFRLLLDNPVSAPSSSLSSEEEEEGELCFLLSTVLDPSVSSDSDSELPEYWHKSDNEFLLIFFTASVSSCCCSAISS